MSPTTAPPDLAFRLRTLSQLTARPVFWLWPGYLPAGYLSLLEGDPGIGKSLLTLDLAARLSTGRPFPDGAPSPGPANVLVLNGEDSPEDALRTRLEALGADLDRVFILDRDDDDLGEPLAFPSQTAPLAAALARTGARLVIIDPITAFLDARVNFHCDPIIRRALAPLRRLAAGHQCVVLLVRHLNKAAGERALYRGLGSIGLLGLCRSAWLLAPDLKEPTRCILAQQKNNLAPPQPALALTITAGAQGRPELAWHGRVDWTAAQLLAAAGHAAPSISPVDRAREFLADFLDDGPRTAREIWTAAQQQGLAERTLHRAKKDLDIRSERIYLDRRPVNYWLLPRQQLPATVPPEAIVPSLEEYLAPLRELYPPSTPLDDL